MPTNPIASSIANWFAPDERTAVTMRVRSRVAIGALVTALAGCEDEPTAPGTPLEMFETFWATFDREYSYFEYKRINWDSLRTVFRPQAIVAGSEAVLIPILKEMVAPLRDLHVWFISPTGRVDFTFAPTVVANWDPFVWSRLTSTCNFVFARPDLGHCTMLGFAYVFIRSWNERNFSIADLDSLVDRYRDAPGMIIDVRPNAGGQDQLGLALAGRFAVNETAIGYVQYRDGPDHDDFGRQIARRVSPRGAFQFLKPVIVLAAVVPIRVLKRLSPPCASCRLSPSWATQPADPQAIPRNTAFVPGGTPFRVGSKRPRIDASSNGTAFRLT